MARTILRDRSGELVRSVQLADRTGIVAASAPKAVESHDEETDVLGFAAVSGELQVAVAPVTTEAAVAGEERRLVRRVRRNLLVAAAAVALLGVGWIAGDNFGVEPGAAPEPAVAARTAPNPVPAAPVQPAPSSVVPPQVPVTSSPAPAPAQAPATTQPTRKKTQPTAVPTPDKEDARTDTVETTTPDKRFGRTLDEQIQQLFESWSWARTEPSIDLDEEQDRSARYFGPFGR